MLKPLYLSICSALINLMVGHNFLSKKVNLDSWSCKQERQIMQQKFRKPSRKRFWGLKNNNNKFWKRMLFSPLTLSRLFSPVPSLGSKWKSIILSFSVMKSQVVITWRITRYRSHLVFVSFFPLVFTDRFIRHKIIQAHLLLSNRNSVALYDESIRQSWCPEETTGDQTLLLPNSFHYLLSLLPKANIL